MQLGELIEKMTTSDRLVIINAAGQVIYRGYAANFAHGTINPLRRVKRFGLDMETYKRTEKMWDWANIRELPEQIPVEQLGQYDIGQLQKPTGSRQPQTAGRESWGAGLMLASTQKRKTRAVCGNEVAEEQDHGQAGLVA